MKTFCQVTVLVILCAMIGTVSTAGVARADFYVIPRTGLQVDVQAIPGKDEDDPAHIKIAVEKGTEKVYDGVVTIGETIELNEFELSIPELRRWCYVVVVRSPFLNLIFFGFWSALAGLAISLVPRVTAKRGAVK